KRIRMRARRRAGAARQPGQASTAAATPAATSSAVAKGTWRSTSPVAGLVTSPSRVVRAGVARPPIQSGSRSSVVRSILASCAQAPLACDPALSRLRAGAAHRHRGALPNYSAKLALVARAWLPPVDQLNHSSPMLLHRAAGRPAKANRDCTCGDIRLFFAAPSLLVPQGGRDWNLRSSATHQAHAL